MLQERGYIDPDVDLDAFFAQLMQENVIGQDGEGNLVLAAGGERQIRRDALDEIFGGLQKSMTGSHSVANAGQGTERLTETRPYQFGDDPMSIDSIRSLQNAMKHNDPGGRDPHHRGRSGSVRDRAQLELRHGGDDRHLALHDPLRRGPHHAGEESRAGADGADPDEVSEGRHRRAALRRRRARGADLRDPVRAGRAVPHEHEGGTASSRSSILRRRKHNNKQIFMITDGKPSALTENGRLYTNSFGLDMKIVNRTLEEADRCRRAGIPITTFMLATDPMLVNFVEQLSKINRGRAFYSSPDRLGEYILADYIRNRRKFVH